MRRQAASLTETDDPAAPVTARAEPVVAPLGEGLVSRDRLPDNSGRVERALFVVVVVHAGDLAATKLIDDAVFALKLNAASTTPRGQVE